MKKILCYLILTSLTIFSINILADTKIIVLPKPNIQQSQPLNQLLLQRRSVRSFQDKPLTLKQISTLLWAAQGITNKQGFRTAPSAGALYPLEIYIVKNDGVWHYLPKQQAIEQISNKDLRSQMAETNYNQKFTAQASMNVIITAIYSRTTQKYGSQGIPFLWIEAGHAGQNLILEATNLGLGAVTLGGFDAKKIAKLLNLPKEETVLYLIPVGYKK